MPVTVFMLLGAFLFVISKPYNLDGTSEIRNVTVLSEIKVPVGSLQQGILACNGYYSSNHQTLTMFDHDWNIIRARQMRFDGISRPHIGILSCSESGDIIAGVIDLDAYENATKKFNSRYSTINWSTYHNSHPFEDSSNTLYKWAPIADELKKLDKEIVLNSMILKWNNIQKDFKKLTSNFEEN